jgi:hypothetical protein
LKFKYLLNQSDRNLKLMFKKRKIFNCSSQMLTRHSSFPLLSEHKCSFRSVISSANANYPLSGIFLRFSKMFFLFLNVFLGTGTDRLKTWKSSGNFHSFLTLPYIVLSIFSKLRSSSLTTKPT